MKKTDKHRWLRSLPAWGMLLTMLMAGCEEETDWTPDTVQTDLLVVQGMLTNELKGHDVVLTRTFPDLNGTPSAVQGATVTLSDGQQVWTLRERDTLPGTYTTPVMQGVIGRVYTLHIQEGGKNYDASTHMVPVTPLDPLRYHAVAGTGDDTLYVLDFGESNIPAMEVVYADWSHLEKYAGLPDSLTHAVLVHYTLDNVDPNALFPPAAETVKMPAGTWLVRRKYALAADYQEYLRTLLSETAWRGSVFDVLPGNVHSNLTAGATGFFAACTVTEERIFLIPGGE